MKKKRIIITLLTALVLKVPLCSCVIDQSDIVSENLRKEADNFNCIRQITVINCLQGDVLFQMTGRISIEADTADNQLEIIVEVEKGKYKKHFIGLSDNVTYVVEDITSSEVNNYKYTLNYNPKMWIPYEFDVVD